MRIFPKSQLQHEIVSSGLLDSGFNCILQMPTGSGKTWLAEKAIGVTLKDGLRAIYLSPLRALAEELKIRWERRFSEREIGIFTGDFGANKKKYPVSFRDAQLMIMTPERLDACTRSWRSHWSWIPEVDLLVVDELHMLGDPHRGARLEGALSRFKRLNPFARILGLSATLGNRIELADWLGAVEYGSDVRPIPLDWKIVRFRKASEKPDLLLREISSVIRGSGKSLVFVQSRRRAEFLSSFLLSNGIRSLHHHAGLGFAERRDVEDKLRSHQIDVVVATSTLEMGLNLPVRQVILYDIQEFDGSEFRPLPTNNVWQRVGRAGRPGYDEVGQAIIIAPSWDHSPDRYEAGRFEPIKSGLSSVRAVSEQIVAEVSSGLASTRQQLYSMLSVSLASKQGNLPDPAVIVDQMIRAEMLIEKEDENSDVKKVILRATRLGRIATRHFLEPSTVLLFRRALQLESLTMFDLLLINSLSVDCQPVLPCDFEELDDIEKRLAAVPSYVRHWSWKKIDETFNVSGKRFLAGIKMALVAMDWCGSGDLKQTSEGFNCYSFEVTTLVESLTRLLTAMSAVTGKPMALDEVDIEDICPHTQRLKILIAMIEGGLDEYAASLTLITGIGPKIARRLSTAGVDDLLAFSKCNVGELPKIEGVNKSRLTRWIEESKEISRTFSTSDLFDSVPKIETRKRDRKKNVDPYRLRRATELIVEPSKPGIFLVSGGSEPHIVLEQYREYSCDCLDWLNLDSPTYCKHILAVRLHQKEGDLKVALKNLTEKSDESSFQLFELWMDNSSVDRIKR